MRTHISSDFRKQFREKIWLAVVDRLGYGRVPHLGVAALDWRATGSSPTLALASTLG
jgi:hypothetical protein